MPSSDAWISDEANACTALTVVRPDRARSASTLDLPSCISCNMRENSTDSGPEVLRATWDTAASKPSPASTHTVSMSSTSASSLP